MQHVIDIVQQVNSIFQRSQDLYVYAYLLTILIRIGNIEKTYRNPLMVNFHTLRIPQCPIHELSQKINKTLHHIITGIIRISTFTIAGEVSLKQLPKGSLYLRESFTWLESGHSVQTYFFVKSMIQLSAVRLNIRAHYKNIQSCDH